mgnify:CR=1 FL=1
MARGQDAPMQTGGKIDPYVAQSVAQGRQGAENKLLTAMQNKAAMERTQVQEAGATARTGMQVGAQERMQAAQLEAQDRRAAEAERGRRETQEWTAAQNKITRRLEKEMEDNRLGFEKATHQDDIDRMEELDKRASDIAIINAALGKYVADTQRSTTFKILSTSNQARKKEQEFITTVTEMRQEAEAAEDVYNKTKDKVKDDLEYDARFKYNAELSQYTGKTIASGPERMLNDRLQSMLAENGSAIAADDLQGFQGKLAEKIRDGKVAPEDIKIAMSVADAFVEKAESKADAAKSSAERNYWKRTRTLAADKMHRIRALANDSTSIKDSNNLTVKNIINEGLAHLDGRSMGSEILKLAREGLGVDDYMTQLKQSYEPMSFPEITGLQSKWAESLVPELQNIFNSNEGD